jgi:hypothetical protein
VSRHFTNKFRVVKPIRQQAVIKTLLDRALEKDGVRKS